MTRSKRILICLFMGAVLIGVVTLWVASRRQPSTPTVTESHVFMLVAARDYRPLINSYEVKPSGDFMILRQHVVEPNIAQPVAQPSPDPQVIEYDCAMLTITINSDRSVTLNGNPLGTLDDTNPLASKLSDIFNQRVEQRYFRRGLETRADLAAIDRIPRTVLLQPSAPVTYDDVVRLLEVLEQVHANPIGLQIDHLQTPTAPCGPPSNKSLDASGISLFSIRKT